MSERLVGTVYLLHFDRPLGHARHYLGWALDLDRRLAHHAAGTGARILQVAIERGIGWTLARTWENATRTREAQLKRRGGRSRMCPICKAQLCKCDRCWERRRARPDFVGFLANSLDKHGQDVVAISGPSQAAIEAVARADDWEGEIHK